jgi:hypothetical protein
MLTTGRSRAGIKAIIHSDTTVLSIPALFKSRITATLPTPEPIKSAKYSFPLIPGNSVKSIEYKYPPIRDGMVPRIMYVSRLLTLGSR